MRLFVAIPLAESAKRELNGVIARVRGEQTRILSGPDPLRWTGPESWHITLQFLGEANEEQLQCLSHELGKVRSVSVPVALGELGCFDRAGVLFADVVLSDELLALQREVVKATARCGFVAEDRPFHPHITLARMKGHGRSSAGRGSLGRLIARTGGKTKFSGLKADEFLLYESHLDSEGARYEIRKHFPLGPA